MKATYRVLFLFAAISFSAIDSQVFGVEWINPAGGSFVNPSNWSPGGPPSSGIPAFFLLHNEYSVDFFGFNAASSSLTIGAGDVTFNLNFNQEYEVEGVVDVGVSGLPNPSQVSLVFQGGGTLFAESVEIHNGAQFVGFSPNAIFAPEVTVHQGGELTGTAAVSGNVTNNGTVAPGFLGTTTRLLDIDGNYTQSATGTLQVETGGSTPIFGHDRLEADLAQLAGKLTVTFDAGYTPDSGHGVSALQAGTIVGRFDSLSIPDLDENLAARIYYEPSFAGVTFATPVALAFDSGLLAQPPAHNYWGNTVFWAGNVVPDGSHVINLFNNQTGPRAIELDNSVPGSERAFVHKVTVAGSNHTMTLSLPANTHFTATNSMTIGNNGIVKLNGGTVHSNRVAISPGGLLEGVGTIDSDLEIGNNTGSVSAEFSPGLSPGIVNVTGNLTVGDNGKLKFEVDSAVSFDKLMVTKSADLGGTIEIDATGVDINSILNTTFEMISAANVTDQFDLVKTIGAPSYYFSPFYTESAVSMGVFQRGDVNRKFGLDLGDITAFAQALKDPDGFAEDFGIGGDGPGDINGDNILNFDDIMPFASIHSITLTADEVIAMIANYSPVPEPTSLALFVLSLSVVAATRSFRDCTTG